MALSSKILKLLRSGDFTIIYWDSDCPTLYKGKWDIDKECAKDDYETMNKSEVSFEDGWDDGYMPYIVTILIKALGGKSGSI